MEALASRAAPQSLKSFFFFFSKSLELQGQWATVVVEQLPRLTRGAVWQSPPSAAWRASQRSVHLGKSTSPYRYRLKKRATPQRTPTPKTNRREFRNPLPHAFPIFNLQDGGVRIIAHCSSACNPRHHAPRQLHNGFSGSDQNESRRYRI